MESHNRKINPNSQLHYEQWTLKGSLRSKANGATSIIGKETKKGKTMLSNRSFNLLAMKQSHENCHLKKGD